MKQKSKALFIWIIVLLMGSSCAKRYPIYPMTISNIDPVYELSNVEHIAVMPFASSPDNPLSGPIISDLIITFFLKDTTFTMIERNQIESVINELNFQQSDITAKKNIVKLGRMLGADLMVFGNVGRYDVQRVDVPLSYVVIPMQYGPMVVPQGGNTYYTSSVVITLRIVDVETGKNIYSASSSLENVQEGVQKVAAYVTMDAVLNFLFNYYYETTNIKKEKWAGLIALDTKDGVVIRNVARKSPCKYRILEGDILKRINKRRAGSWKKGKKLISKVNKGESCDFVIERYGEKIELQVIRPADSE